MQRAGINISFNIIKEGVKKRAPDILAMFLFLELICWQMITFYSSDIRIFGLNEKIAFNLEINRVHLLQRLKKFYLKE